METSKTRLHMLLNARFFGAMMALTCTVAASLAQSTVPQVSQPTAQPAGSTATLRLNTQLVFVPVEVLTHKGEPIYTLKSDQFLLQDNGVSQPVRIEETEPQDRPLALVVMVQCSRSAFTEFPKIRGLSTMVDALIGGAPARVAVADFGTEAALHTDFTANPRRRENALNAIEPCDDDGGAAILDAVAYANKLFEKSNPPGRRVILLVSETRDHGSKIKAEETIEALGRGNVVLDALSFSPARDAMVEDLKHANGASGGVIGLLLAAVQALRKNAPKELARQSGGEYINFASQNSFDKGLTTLANRVHNFYMLTFRPRFPPDQLESAAPGLHSITVKIREYPDATVRHRASYWSEPPAPPAASP